MAVSDGIADTPQPCKCVIQVQSRPLVWSTNVRSTRLYGQFLPGPERIRHFVSEKTHLKVRKARLYGQFSGQFGLFWPS